MKKNLFLTISIGATAAFSALFLSCQTTKQPAAPQATSTGTAAVATVATPVEAIPAVSAYEPVSIKEKLDYITTDITYPRFPGNKELSSAIERYVQQDYPPVKAEALETKGKNPTSVLSYEYITNYEVIEDATFTSVLLTTYTYTGGAHGLESNKSFVWNKKTKALQNVVQASGLSYTAIAAKCQTALKKRDFYTADGSVEAGTQPDDEHLGTFTIDGKKLTIYFDPYAVAPYSEGIQTVDITLP